MQNTQFSIKTIVVEYIFEYYNTSAREASEYNNFYR